MTNTEMALAEIVFKLQAALLNTDERIEELYSSFKYRIKVLMDNVDNLNERVKYLESQLKG